MVGDYIKCFTRKELSNEEIVKVDVNCLRWAEENPEEFSKLTRPIPLTEDVLRKIEGVEVEESPIQLFNGKRVVMTIRLRKPIIEVEMFLLPKRVELNVWHLSTDRFSGILIYGGKEYYCHQLQQRCRCLGHELVINF